MTERLDNTNEELIHKLLDRYEDGKLDIETARNILEPFQELHRENDEMVHDNQSVQSQGNGAEHNVNIGEIEENTEEYASNGPESQPNTEEINENLQEIQGNTREFNDHLSERNGEEYEANDEVEANTEEYDGNEHEGQTRTEENNRYVQERQQYTQGFNDHQNQGNSEHYNANDDDSEENLGEDHDNNHEETTSREEYDGYVQDSQKNTADIYNDSEENRDSSEKCKSNLLQPKTMECSDGEYETHIDDQLNSNGKTKAEDTGVRNNPDGVCDIGKSNENLNGNESENKETDKTYINENHAYENGNQYNTETNQCDNFAIGKTSIPKPTIPKKLQETQVTDSAHATTNADSDVRRSTASVDTSSCFPTHESNKKQNLNYNEVTNNSTGNTEIITTQSRLTNCHEENLESTNSISNDTDDAMNKKYTDLNFNSIGVPETPVNITHNTIHMENEEKNVKHTDGLDVCNNKYNSKDKTNDNKMDQYSNYKNNGDSNANIKHSKEKTKISHEKYLSPFISDSQTLQNETNITARLHSNSIDYSKLSHQNGSESRTYKDRYGAWSDNSEGYNTVNPKELESTKEIDNHFSKVDPKEIESTKKVDNHFSKLDPKELESTKKIDDHFNSSELTSHGSINSKDSSSIQSSFKKNACTANAGKYQSSYNSDSDTSGVSDGPRPKKTKFMPKHRLVFRK